MLKVLHFGLNRLCLNIVEISNINLFNNLSDSMLIKSETNDTESSKPSPSKEQCDAVQAALNHLIQGKRHLLVKDIVSAVNSFQEACKLMSNQFGELANECGESYFYYGKALLELSRIESGVLGERFEKEDKQNVENDESENSEICDEKSEDKTSDENEEIISNKKDEDEEEDEDNEEIKQNESEENVEDEIENDDGDLDKDEDVSTLQLAWEFLEMAKIIFRRQTKNNRNMVLSLAQAFLLLGEVSMESENHHQSIMDLHECLQLQLGHLHSHDRLLAETYFQLGTAYMLSEDVNTAEHMFRKVISILQERINCLLESGDSEASVQGCIHDYTDSTDMFYSRVKEAKELEDLLPEIQEKLEDVEELRKEQLRKQQEPSSSISETVLGCSSSPVNNVSHLVHKQKKNKRVSDADLNSVNNSKKQKMEDN